MSLFSDGAKADLAAKDGDRAAYKQVALALAELARGRQRQARAAAEQAIANGGGMLQVRFLAGRVFAQAGAIPQARAIAAKLSAELQAEPQAYGKIIDGVIALERKDARGAVKLLTEATELLDTWIGRFDLGRALPGGWRLSAGRLGVRPLPQAPGRSDIALPRRRAHLRVPAAGATTTRAASARRWARRRSPRPISAIWHSRQRQRRPAGGRHPDPAQDRRPGALSRSARPVGARQLLVHDWACTDAARLGRVPEPSQTERRRAAPLEYAIIGLRVIRRCERVHASGRDKAPRWTSVGRLLRFVPSGVSTTPEQEQSTVGG